MDRPCHPICTGVTVSVAESGSVPNSIEFSEVPTDLIAGAAVELTVNYGISDASAYVVVKLENPNGDNPQGRVTKSGIGSHTFTIQAPESPGDYRLLAQLVSVDGNWSNLGRSKL